jgi:hypothetical protein
MPFEVPLPFLPMAPARLSSSSSSLLLASAASLFSLTSAPSSPSARGFLPSRRFLILRSSASCLCAAAGCAPSPRLKIVHAVSAYRSSSLYACAQSTVSAAARLSPGRPHGVLQPLQPDGALLGAERVVPLAAEVGRQPALHETPRRVDRRVELCLKRRRIKLVVAAVVGGRPGPSRAAAVRLAVHGLAGTDVRGSTLVQPA